MFWPVFVGKERSDGPRRGVCFSGSRQTRLWGTRKTLKIEKVNTLKDLECLKRGLRVAGGRRGCGFGGRRAAGQCRVQGRAGCLQRPAGEEHQLQCAFGCASHSVPLSDPNAYDSPRSGRLLTLSSVTGLAALQVCNAGHLAKERCCQSFFAWPYYLD